MGTGNQLSYAVHVKPVRKHQLHHMVGVDDEGSRAFTGKGTYILRTRNLTRPTHTVRTVSWWFSNCTILKGEFILYTHNPTPHNPSYVTVHVS